MNNYIEEDVLVDAYREEVKKEVLREKMECKYKEDMIEELYGERGE